MSLSRSIVRGAVFVAATQSLAAADPARSFDLAIAGGMLESAAHRGSTQGMTGAGAGVELLLGYHVLPQLAIGAYSTLEAGVLTGTASPRDFSGGTAGLRAEWHFDPSLTVDTWASIGSGVRWTALANDSLAGSTSLIGVELAKFQFGGDFPVSPGLSIGPAVAFSASTFVANDTMSGRAYTEIEDKVLDLTITAGVRIRFNR